MNHTKTFGEYIDAYAALPGVTHDMVTAFSDAAMESEAGTLDTAHILYTASRELAETGTLTAATFTALADHGHADIPRFVIGCAPTTNRSMREIGLWLMACLQEAATTLANFKIRKDTDRG